MEIPVFNKIEELHEYVFQLLYERHKEDNDFLFTMREKNDFFSPYYHYWFKNWSSGLASFSCWEGVVQGGSIYNIRFDVSWQGKCSLYLQSIEPIKFRFLEKMIPLLSKKTTDKLSSAGVWIKSYPSPFSQEMFEDKKIIDDFLAKEQAESNEPLGIEFIKPEKFQTQLQHILALREKRGLELSNINKKELYLKSFQLENIGHFTNISLDFSNRITCIIGENGTGKSTLLRAIALTLTGTNQRKIDKEHHAIQSLMKIKGEKNGYYMYESQGQTNLSYQVGGEKNIFHNNILFETENNDIYIKDSGDYQNLINQNNFPILILGFPQLQSKKGNYQEVPSPIKKPEIKDLLPLIYNEADYRFEAFSHWLIKLHSIGNDKIIKKEPPIEFEIIDNVFHIISKVTEQTITFRTIDHESETVWVTTDDAPEGIPLSLISQGYNNVFGWIGFLVKRLAETNPNSPDFTKEPAMVFIDEIDTYLHPEWQRTILRVLVDTFTATQFVITTHSFAVATSVPDIKIYRLEKQSNHTIICKEFTDYKPYGMDANDALVQLMDTPNRAAKDANEDINRLFRLIENNQLTEAQNFLSLLTEKYDSRDSKLVEAEMLIDTKKLLQL